MVKIIISLIIIFILNLIDYFQTTQAIRFYGLSVEANPIARFLFENNCGWIAKLIVLPILLTILGVVVRIDKRQIWAIYLLLICFFILVIHNFGVLWQLGLL